MPSAFLSRISAAALILGGVLYASGAIAQNFDDVEIRTTKVADGVYVFEGAGGNMALSVGSDGAFLVDDQFAPLSEKILAAIAELTDKPVRFVVNTHWHPDHTGGNENMGKAGAFTVAHENVRRRMGQEQFLKLFPRGDRAVPPAPQGNLPIITFNEAVTFHFNDQAIRVMKGPNAHTDGDSIVHFQGADVLHVGDAFLRGYPFLDLNGGGSIDGAIAFASRVIALMGPKTQLIAGHAPVSNREHVVAFRDVLETARARVAALLADGKTADEAVNAKPLADLDEEWGGGYVSSDLFVRTIHTDLADRQ